MNVATDKFIPDVNLRLVNFLNVNFDRSPWESSNKITVLINFGSNTLLNYPGISSKNISFSSSFFILKQDLTSFYLQYPPKNQNIFRVINKFGLLLQGHVTQTSKAFSKSFSISISFWPTFTPMTSCKATVGSKSKVLTDINSDSIWGIFDWLHKYNVCQSINKQKVLVFKNQSIFQFTVSFYF